MKLEFDEKNLMVVSAIAVMLDTIAGNERGVLLPIELGDIDPENVKKAFLGTSGDKSINDVVTDAVKAEAQAGKNLAPPDLKAGEGLDSDKYPWDARINAKTKTKNADDTWKVLRRPKKVFIDDEAWQAFIVTVRAELKAGTAGEDLPPPNDFGKTTETVEQGEAEPDMSFAVLMKLVTGSGGKITPEELQEICESYEIEDPAHLSKPENKILLPAIYEELQEIISE